MSRRIDARILTPFGQKSGMGNWRTASRYAQMLRASGINASIYEPSQIDDACTHSGQRTVAIVLNAARSADAVFAFVKEQIPVMLVMTGTDLYGALAPAQSGSARYQTTEQALHLARLIVVLQAEAGEEIRRRWPLLADRVHCLIQTSAPRKPYAPVMTPNSKTVRFLVAGHIREEKDPRTAFVGFHRAFPDGWAVRSGGRRVPVRLIHVGSHQDKTLAQELIRLGAQYPGILLEGPLSHAQTLRQMTHVHCLIQTSISEGGALVVSEAVACRLPVIASAIPAHRGQMGADYPGFFRTGDPDDLARVFMRFVSDDAFVEQLRERGLALASTLASPSSEREALARLIRQLSESLVRESV